MIEIIRGGKSLGYLAPTIEGERDAVTGDEQQARRFADADAARKWETMAREGRAIFRLRPGDSIRIAAAAPLR